MCTSRASASSAVESWVDTLDEISLLFIFPPVAVSAQDLQRAQQDKQAQFATEFVFRNVAIGLHRIQVGADHPFLEGLGEAGTGLPDKGCQVVPDRSLAPTLEVDVPGLPVVDHDVARLEVAVQEGIGACLQQVRLQTVEVVLERDLLELDAGRLEIAVFEIVEVEVDHPRVKLRIRIADTEIQALRTFELDLRQALDCLAEQNRFLFRIDAGAPSFRNQFIQGVISEVFLEIGHFVRGYGVHFRHTDAFAAEMPGLRDEGAILVRVGADHADEGAAPFADPEISPVAAG